jgi:hypothetical protein
MNVKQIYDKHKAIWWARINVGETMTKDDFIKAIRHCLLGSQTQKELVFRQKSGHFPSHMAFNHPNGVFYFQDANEDNGIQVPFTIRIQTPFQLQTMVSLS